MRVLIVDDDNDKIANVVSAIKSESHSFFVDTAISCNSALKKLKDVKYDLLILDILLPMTDDSEPINNGAEIVTKELYRKKYKTPNYIVGITQYQEYKGKFNSLWNVLLYNPSKTDWKNDLIEYIKHIKQAKQHFYENNDEKKPTVYVEGLTDKAILEEAIRLFNPELIDRLSVKSEKGAGASWVARQIIIWAKSLFKNENKEYVKAVGLLDGDPAGIEAHNEIKRVVKDDSSETNTFKVIKLGPQFNKSIIPLYTNGILVPITLEELFDIEYWEYAESKGWLESRTNLDSVLKDPKGWDKINFSLSEYIKSLEITGKEKIYLKKIDGFKKEDFSKYILNLNEDKRIGALQNFKELIGEIEKALF